MSSSSFPAVRSFYLYHFLLLLLPYPKAGEGRGALPFVDVVVRALARARRFLTNTATKVEIALVTTIIRPTIQSGSCSYIIQSPTTGNTVQFSIV